jgi:molecular chaperone GrpE (heat shock protein)
MRVNRLAALTIGTLPVLSTTSLLAQYGGHGGGGGRRGTPGAASGDTSEAGLADFNRALAVQATSDQVFHFPGLTKSTETAKKRAQDLSGLSGKADSTTDFSRKTAALKEAVEEAQGSNQDFVKSFTKSQKAGLKELTEKLEKADSEVTKQWKDLERQLGGAKAVSEGIAGTAEKLEKALEEFQSQQIELGKEMGIAPAA